MCSWLHGYSLGFKFIFESETLDGKKWCLDFGNLRPVKEWLDYMFDHALVIAEDDPDIEFLKAIGKYDTRSSFRGKLANVHIVEATGCESFAKMAFDEANRILVEMKAGRVGRYPVNPSVRLVSVECFEHGANSATYIG